MAIVQVTPEDAKAFRKTLKAAMANAMSDLLASSSMNGALPYQQRLARLSIMFVESFRNEIDNDWYPIAIDVFGLDIAPEKESIVGEEVGRKKSKRK